MPKLIFFVDDDKMIINFLEYTIKNRHDYDVRSFFSGEDCIKNLGMKPDLVVIDHILTSNAAENMSGMDTLIEIKKHDKSLPVIILTGMEDKKLAKKYLANGAVEFILKNDYFVDTLMEAIDKQFI